MNEVRSDRPFQFTLFGFFVVVTISCVVFASPDIALYLASSAALLLLGVACVRGACVNRTEGWVSGLVFGLLLVAAGTLALVVSVGLSAFGR